MSRLLLILIMALFLAACSGKYHRYRGQYGFRSADQKPLYADLNYWAAHPWKKDPSDSVPEPLKNEWRDSTVDVFFLHPTTFTRKKDRQQLNAGIDDDYINAKTDYSSILYQASVFNQQARVFAPRYRQAHIWNFFRKDKAEADRAFDTAYEDIRAAFLYYLQHWNQHRPLIIASHSQGSLHAERLLKEFFEGKALMQKLVAAYVIGWPVPEHYFTSIPLCRDSLQTGCVCSWRTLRRNYVPPFMSNEKETAWVTNPLTWGTGPEYAPRSLNKGSVLTRFNKVYPRSTDAWISRGLLYVRKPRFPMSFLYFTRNYHIADINLFYINLRENISRRIAMYWKR